MTTNRQSSRRQFKARTRAPVTVSSLVRVLDVWPRVRAFVAFLGLATLRARVHSLPRLFQGRRGCRGLCNPHAATTGMLARLVRLDRLVWHPRLRQCQSRTPQTMRIVVLIPWGTRGPVALQVRGSAGISEARLGAQRRRAFWMDHHAAIHCNNSQQQFQPTHNTVRNERERAQQPCVLCTRLTYNGWAAGFRMREGM
jgi:hypothetical protein